MYKKMLLDLTENIQWNYKLPM